MKDEEIIGKKFNRLTVLEKLPKDKNKPQKFLCKCECGNIINTPTKHKLITGHSKSCGCLKREKMSDNMSKYKHRGKEFKREYDVWSSMKARCYNKNDRRYNGYGSRGIKVCDRWLESFDNFIEDMGKKPFDNAQLDRIDNDGDYTPENCRWTTPFDNVMNRRFQKNMDNNIHKGYNSDKYFTQVSRTNKLDGKIYKRISYLSYDKKALRKIRDDWIKEFNKNKELWFENTKNKNYYKGESLL